jgi:hypothetical protein
MRKVETKWRNLGRLMTRAVAVGAICSLPAIVLADDSNINVPSNQPANQNQPSAQSLNFPAGFEQKDQSADSDIKSELVKLTDRAFTKGDYDKVLAELAKPDKERAKQFTGVDQDALNRAIDQITTQWKAKYGQDFAVNDTNLTFNDHVQIVQGDVMDPVAAANNWPVPATTGQGMSSLAPGNNPAANQANPNQVNSDQARMASDRATGDQATNPRVDGLTKGTAVALVQFHQMHGMPDIMASMQHETIMGWTFAIPQERTGDQIYNDFSQRLNYIAAHSGQWPTEQADAYRMLTHQALAALYGVQGNMSSANAQ